MGRGQDPTPGSSRAGALPGATDLVAFGAQAGTDATTAANSGAPVSIPMQPRALPCAILPCRRDRAGAAGARPEARRLPALGRLQPGRGPIEGLGSGEFDST